MINKSAKYSKRKSSQQKNAHLKKPKRKKPSNHLFHSGDSKTQVKSMIDQTSPSKCEEYLSLKVLKTSTKQQKIVDHSPYVRPAQSKFGPMTEDRRKQMRKYMQYSAVNKSEICSDTNNNKIEGNCYDAKGKKKVQLSNSIILSSNSQYLSPSRSNKTKVKNANKPICVSSSQKNPFERVKSNIFTLK